MKQGRLLQAGIGLRRQLEAVAALRREVPEDYLFDAEDGKIKLSQLFSTASTAPRSTARIVEHAKTRG